MNALSDLVHAAISDFEKAAVLAHAEFSAEVIAVEIAAKPHKAPITLPTGKMAVYAFFLGGQALKVGKAGPKSKARYTSQHYNPDSALSTLARSILTNAGKVEAVGLAPEAVGNWIKEHTDRVNLLVPISFGLPRLSLLEAFLHVRWKPLFEGRPDTSEDNCGG